MRKPHEALGRVWFFRAIMQGGRNPGEGGRQRFHERFSLRGPRRIDSEYSYGKIAHERRERPNGALEGLLGGRASGEPPGRGHVAAQAIRGATIFGLRP